MSKVPAGWVITPISNICESIIDCVNKTAPVVDFKTPYKMIRTTNVRHGRVDTEHVRYVTKDTFDTWTRRGAPQNGDIILTREAPVGEAGILKNADGIFLGQRTIMYRVNKMKANNYFILYSILGNFCQRQIENFSNGGTVAHMRVPDCEEILLKVPPLPEQTKIAQILSTWDKAIATTEKLIGNSQQQKKALMQSLLTGKKRLPGFEESNEYQTTRYGKIPLDWGFKPVDDIAKNISIKNKEGKDYPVLSCSKYSGFIDSLKYFNKKIYSDNTDGYKIIKKGWFGFPSNHIEEGSIGLQSLYEVGIVSPIYIIFKVNENIISSLYLYALFKTDHYKQIFSASTNASVDRRGSLRWDEFGKIKVPVPPLPEQQKIAAILTAADNEIELLQKKLVFLKQEKAALMQQLLTGKRRVKIDTTEECMDA